MKNSTQMLVNINDLPNFLLDEGFLTDEKLKGESDYKGWELMSDNHTEATYFCDSKTGLELYCSPCFENDWGTIYFQMNNIYGEDGFGECLDVIEVDLKPYFGDIEKQKEIWRGVIYDLIDNVEKHVPTYNDIKAEHMVSELLHQMYENNEYMETYRNDKATFERIEFLKECLITEFKKVKNKK